MSDLDARRQELADALAKLEQADIVDFNGHFSARLPGTRLLINAGGSVRSALTAADIATVDFDGRPEEGEAPPPMEFHIHASIYRRRTDVHAVVHTHPLWSTVPGTSGKALHLLRKAWDYHHAKLRSRA